MTRQTSFDDQLRDWIREVPAASPNLAVSILESTRETPQRRRSRWPTLANGPALAGAAMAAAFVALVGGFLLLGLVTFDDAPPGTTPSPEPSVTASPNVEPTLAPRPTIPPSAELDSFRRTMQASALEPLAEGVERIAGDGSGNRYDSWSTPASEMDPASLRLVVGPAVSESGDIWVAGYRATGSIRLGRLGEENTAVLDSAISSNDEGLWLRSDGAGGLWVGAANDLNHFDGTTWHWPDTEFNSGIHDVAVLPDGSAMVVWTHDRGPVANRVGHVSRDGWVDLEADVAAVLGIETAGLRFWDVASSPGGTLRVIVHAGLDDGLDESWTVELDERWTVLPVAVPDGVFPLATTVAPDGAWWTYYGGDDRVLTRELHGETTIVSDAERGLPAIGPRGDRDPPRERLQVGADGTVWLQTENGRLASFDGRVWAARALGVVDAFDVAPDGTAVALGRDGELYRVRPGGEVIGEVTGELPASPTSEDAVDHPLDGYESEEVEPGVHRLAHDGHRDLTYPAGSDDRRSLQSTVMVTGRDDSVWHFGPTTYYRLGDERTFSWAESSPAYGQPPKPGEARSRAAGHVLEPDIRDDIEVGPDGTVWYALGLPAPWTWDGDWQFGLWSFDGTAWQPSGPPETVNSVEVLPDASTWATFISGEPLDLERIVVRRSPDGETWEPVGGPFEPDDPDQGIDVVRLYMSTHGDAWLAGRQLYRLIDGAWVPEALPALDDGYFELAVGDDGTVWLTSLVSNGDRGSDLVARFVDGSWETWAEDSIPERGNARWASATRVGPDGALWMALKGDRECGGLGRFDGEAWQVFLPGRCIYTFDIDGSGSAWVHASPVRWNRAGDDLLLVRDIETFVIHPSEQGR